jgi:hypothetical protein
MSMTWMLASIAASNSCRRDVGERVVHRDTGIEYEILGGCVLDYMGLRNMWTVAQVEDGRLTYVEHISGHLLRDKDATH